MIHIRKIPYIYEETDRWGTPTGYFNVMDCHGYVSNKFANSLFEYEGYKLEDDGIKELMKTIATTNFYDLHKIQLPKMQKLLKDKRGLILEFNMLINNKNDGDVSQYIRSTAVFSQKTLKKHTIFDSLKIKYLKLKCYFLNKGNND